MKDWFKVSLLVIVVLSSTCFSSSTVFAQPGKYQLVQVDVVRGLVFTQDTIRVIIKLDTETGETWELIYDYMIALTDTAVTIVNGWKPISDSLEVEELKGDEARVARLLRFQELDR